MYSARPKVMDDEKEYGDDVDVKGASSEDDILAAVREATGRDDGATAQWGPTGDELVQTSEAKLVKEAIADPSRKEKLAGAVQEAALDADERGVEFAMESIFETVQALQAGVEDASEAAGNSDHVAWMEEWANEVRDALTALRLPRPQVDHLKPGDKPSKKTIIQLSNCPGQMANPS